MKNAVTAKQKFNLFKDTRELAHNRDSWNSDDNSIALTNKCTKNFLQIPCAFVS
jgi:hypothetical protein